MKQGWQIKKLGEVGKLQRGGNFLKRDFIEDGFPCIHYGQIHMKLGVATYQHLSCIPKELALKKAKMASTGDIIIAITSEDVAGSCKCTAWLGDYDIAVGAHTAIFKHSLNPLFVSYYFQSPLFYKEKEKYTHGFKVVEIRPDDIAQIPILVPPLSEQQRIVSLLDAEFAKIDALKANAEKNLQNAKDLFQAALKKELEPKDGWKKDLLSKVAYISRGRSQHRPRNEAILYGGDYPFIQTGDIRDANGRTITTFNQTYSEIGLQQSKLWKKGTICITIAANIGETAILGMDACFPDSVVGIIPNNQIVCTDFLNYCLIKEKDELNEIAHGTAQKNINVAILEKVLITYPIDITTQQSILSRLDALNEKCKTLQANYEKTLSLCDDLKQALLRSVFGDDPVAIGTDAPVRPYGK